MAGGTSEVAARPGTTPPTTAFTPEPTVEHTVGARRERGVLARALAVPLLAKLVVADLLINIAALLVVRQAPAEFAAEIVVVSLLVTLILNAGLVYWALLPLRALERTAIRVSRGDLRARFTLPPLTDRNIARIGATLNDLLDGLTADRMRVRHLASQVISAGDQERAHIARELHDSTAQALSAVEMILTSALRDPVGAGEERLRLLRDIVTHSLQEVRTLSHNVHPRVLDDLGLVAALEYLARRTREQHEVAVWVTSDAHAPVPAPVASVLYRVAQEAVRNAVRHGRARELHLTLLAGEHDATLEVRDDGTGFDPALVEAARNGMGIFIMRERLALVDGTLALESRPGAGTTLRASAPFAPEGDA